VNNVSYNEHHIAPTAWQTQHETCREPES
jgi:hypothetical protein